MSPSAQDLIIDGRYGVERVLGRSPGWVTLLARQLGIQRRVVVRLLKNPDYLERLKSEVLTLAAIVHPNVLKVFDSDFQPDGRAFAVYDYNAGQRMDDASFPHPVPVHHVTELIRQVCAALVAAHEVGAAHGRLGRKYVFVESGGHAHQPRVTLNGFEVSPEHPEHRVAQARCADIRAVGALAVELLGERLEQRNADAQVVPALRDAVLQLTQSDIVPPTAQETLDMWAELADLYGHRDPSQAPDEWSTQHTPKTEPPRLVTTTRNLF